MYADIFNSNYKYPRKYLKLDRNLRKDQIENIFARSQQVETLDCSYDDTTMGSLKMLPILGELILRNLPKGHSHLVSYNLMQLPSINKLTVESVILGGKLMRVLSEQNGNLTELVLRMPCTSESLEKIIKFKKLEVLVMRLLSRAKIPSTVCKKFPVCLTDIKIDGLKIACSDFLALLNRLNLLTEFDLGRGEICSQMCKFFLQQSDFLLIKMIALNCALYYREK